MTTLSQITKKTKPFRAWLSSNGAEVLEPTNPYEVVRFKAGNVTSIIYRSEANKITMTGVAATAWDAFAQAKPWRAAPKTPRPRGHRITAILRTVRARDGGACFYCGEAVPKDDETLEHLVPTTHGGPNHVSNLAIAHKDCNAAAGHLPVVAKVAMRDTMRESLRASRCVMPEAGDVAVDYGEARP